MAEKLVEAFMETLQAVFPVRQVIGTDREAVSIEFAKEGALKRPGEGFPAFLARQQHNPAVSECNEPPHSLDERRGLPGTGERQRQFPSIVPRQRPRCNSSRK